MLLELDAGFVQTTDRVGLARLVRVDEDANLLLPAPSIGLATVAVISEAQFDIVEALLLVVGDRLFEVDLLGLRAKRVERDDRQQHEHTISTNSGRNPAAWRSPLLRDDLDRLFRWIWVLFRPRLGVSYYRGGSRQAYCDPCSRDSRGCCGVR